MDKFETLEDYQNSLKEFNERTRKSYEDFIQEYGDESQKLQLRCTPFTEKKGRYGVASLDFGFQIWQSKQAEIDFLNAQLGIKRDQIKGFESEIKKAWQAVDEKDKRIEEINLLIARAKDGYYGFSQDGGDTDNLVKDIEKSLRGDNA